MGGGLLIVSSMEKTAQQLSRIVSTVSTGLHSTALSGAQARRLTSLTDFKAVIIAGRLKDETAENLAYELTLNGVKPIIIIVDSAEADSAHDMLDSLGVTILTKPLSKEVFLNTIKLVEKITSGEGGIFEKAKLALVQHKGWSEPQAHRYIQKVSMEKRLPRDVTAQYVLKALQREKKNGEDR